METNLAFPFLQSLDKRDKEIVLNNIVEKTFKPSEILFDSGACQGVLMVKKGKIRVYILSEDGREITLYYLKEGDVCVLSVTCLTGTLPIKALVKAEDLSEVSIISNDIFKNLHKKYFEIQKFIMDNMANRMSDIMWIVDQVAFKSMDIRVSNYLLAKESTIIYATHDEISREIGTAREVISRMLKYFEKEDILHLSRGKIKILDINKLKEIVKG